SSACRRATTTRLAPSLANNCAAACPMPELAPVTIATFFAKTPISDLQRQYEGGEVRLRSCDRHSDSCDSMIEAHPRRLDESSEASVRTQCIQRLRHALARNRFGGLEFLREHGHAPFLDQPAQGVQRSGIIARCTSIEYRAPVRQYLLHARVVARGIAAQLFGTQAHGFEVTRQVCKARTGKFAQETGRQQRIELPAQVGVTRRRLSLDHGLQPRLQFGESGEDWFR